MIAIARPTKPIVNPGLPTDGAERNTQPKRERKVDYIVDSRFVEWDAAISDKELDGLVRGTWRPSPAPPRSRQVPRGSTAPHLEALCAAPLFTAEEERLWFLRFNYLKYRAAKLRGSVRNSKRIGSWTQGAETIRNSIAHSNIRLVISLVKTLTDAKNSFDDLLSEGMTCLVRSVEKFDTGRGFRFSTYATRAIRRDLFRLVWRSHRDRTRFASSAQKDLDELVDPPIKTLRTELRWSSIDRVVKLLTHQLDDRERFILDARYGFSDIGGKPTFQRLGQLLGVSKERVRQLEQRAVEKLRNFVEARSLDDPC